MVALGTLSTVPLASPDASPARPRCDRARLSVAVAHTLATQRTNPLSAGAVLVPLEI